MRSLLVAIALAGCVSSAHAHHTGELRVDVPMSNVRDVARAVLIDRYRELADAGDGAPLESAPICFTDGGDRCVLTAVVERIDSGADNVDNGATVVRVARHSELSMEITLVAAGDDVIVRVGARVRTIAPGEPDDGRVRDAARDAVPIWVEREIDQTLAAIRARLGDDRNHRA